MNRLSRFIIPVLLLLSVSALRASASERHMRVGIRIGHFIPQDWLIQGPAETPGSPYYWRGYRGTLGFGDGIDFGFQAGYYFPRWGLRLGLGARSNKKEAKLEEEFFWGIWDYKSKLKVYSVELILIHKLADDNSSFSPYIGIGPGLYIADWKQEITDMWGPEWEESLQNETATSISFLAGFDYPLIWSIFLNGELVYEYAEADWEFKISGRDMKTELRDLNIGGTSLRLGLGYEF